MPFNYQAFTSRNLGFVTEAEQKRLRSASVFIPGVGGMGGSALNCLVRAGVQKFILADFDEFEISNLNRQIFANLDVVGKSKVESTKAQLLKINPDCDIQVFGREWIDQLDLILPQVDLVLNGCDDTAATIKMMRKAKSHGKVAIDAFASMFPSVYVVRPSDPRPEETFKYPSRHVALENLTSEVAAESYLQELIYVMVHSSSLKYVDMEKAKEVLMGKRKRFSFSTMVIGTGVMMAYEAVKVLLDRPQIASCKGVFYNPWTMRVEKPLPALLAYPKRKMIEAFIKKMVK